MSTPVKDIAATMLAQEVQGTSYPVFVVRHKTKVFVEGHDYHGQQRKPKESTDVTSLCESCLKLHDKGEDLPEDCDECFIDAYDYFKWQYDIDPRAVFLTGKGCLEYIEANRDRYGEDAHPFILSAEGNPELQAVMQLVINQLTDELPTHYAS